jgi:hypothetical protein
MTRPDGGVGGAYDPRHLRYKAIRTLVRVIDREDPGETERGFYSTQVAAASRLLSHSEWAEEREDDTKESNFFKMFKSDREAARFLLANYDQLLKIAGMSRDNLLDSGSQPAAPTEKPHGPEAESRKQDPQDAGEAPRGR